MGAGQDDLSVSPNTKILQNSAVLTLLFSQEPTVLSFRNRKDAHELAVRCAFSSCTTEIHTQLANQTASARIASILVLLMWVQQNGCTYLKKKKKISSGQNQFCLRTTFIKFADNVSHDSLFSWGKKVNRFLKNIAGKIDLIRNIH